jgi:putative endonuclease
MTTDRAYVYILASGFKHIYTGVTAKLPEGIREHRTFVHPHCFTAKYNITQLVYYEEHIGIVKAIAREKQIKGWLRVKKIQLIVQSNPTWRDLSEDLLKLPEFEESKMRPPEGF